MPVCKCVCLSVRCWHLWCPGFMPLIRNVLSNFQGLRQGHAVSLTCTKAIHFLASRQSPFRTGGVVERFSVPMLKTFISMEKSIRQAYFVPAKFDTGCDEQNVARNSHSIPVFVCSFIHSHVRSFVRSTAHTEHFGCTFSTSNCHSIYQYFIRWMNMTQNEHEQRLLSTSVCLCVCRRQQCVRRVCLSVCACMRL